VQSLALSQCTPTQHPAPASSLDQMMASSQTSRPRQYSSWTRRWRAGDVANAERTENDCVARAHKACSNWCGCGRSKFSGMQSAGSSERAGDGVFRYQYDVVGGYD
jgi:hypothetical protein